MTSVRHGDLVVDVPAEWADRSTLVFVGPAPAAPAVVNERRAQPSLTVTFTRASKGAKALLDDELAGLAAMSLGFHALGDEPFACAFGEGVLSSHRLELDGVRVRQLFAVCVRGAIAVRAVASVGETDFAKLEPALRAALGSLRVAAGAS